VSEGGAEGAARDLADGLVTGEHGVAGAAGALALGDESDEDGRVRRDDRFERVPADEVGLLRLEGPDTSWP
jgi:hypothetical protein